MENEKFQELVIEQLGKVVQKLEQHDKRFDALEERLGNVEDLLKQHHEDTEKTASQVEQLVTEQDDLTNYFLKRRKLK